VYYYLYIDTIKQIVLSLIQVLPVMQYSKVRAIIFSKDVMYDNSIHVTYTGSYKCSTMCKNRKLTANRTRSCMFQYIIRFRLTQIGHILESTITSILSAVLRSRVE
jgi:hypothetical protein